MEEAKAASGKDFCPVLQQIAKAKLQFADEPLYQALSKCGLAMHFPIAQLNLDQELSYPCFLPKEQLEAVAGAGFLHKVMGVPLIHADRALPAFWDKFQQLYPHHDLFNTATPVDFQRLLPFYLHGDGGRTYKKDSLLVLSMYSALGSGTAKKPVDLQPLKRRRMDPSECLDESQQLGVNLTGQSLTNRFLFCAMKCELYKNKRHRFNALLDHWGRFLAQLFEEGFTFDGETWRVAILGLTGDAPFLREAGNHDRSFSCVGKKHGSTGLKGVCWLCPAGRSGGPPFEDVRVTSALWTGQCGQSNPLPWSEPGPLLQHLALNELDVASFYRPDLFHVYHAGVGKDFAASAIIYAMKTFYKRRNIHLSVDAINEELKQFLQQTKVRINFGRLTLEMLGYSTARSYPFGHWSKNMDTAVMAKFAEYLCVKNHNGYERDAIRQLIVEACGCINHYMHVLFNAGFFLTESEAWQAIQSGQRFLICFSQLAEACCNQRLCLFKLKPKLHYFAHLIHRSWQQFQVNTESVVNALAESTFMLEDFVGHISRLSRRVSAKKHGLKIYYRYMVAAHYQLKQSVDGKDCKCAICAGLC